MQIRPFRDDDEPAVVALWRACGLTRPWNDPHKDIARKRIVQREMFLVGELDGRVVATVMAGYDGHRAWMYYLAVAPAHQRQGLGTLLVRRVEEEMLVRGCPKVSLLVRSANEQVRAFYRKLGYAQDDSVPLGKRLIPDE
ncbi:GNAT family acetyltransferase [Ramlibacter ginsenosidimutans]|uniref:GNAT family acetyltransferase n=1 Tax=Ramlibacter ginsenosidimutans TaxID=502333 RepID=A0A934TPY2_9BURK|nr:GNAT family acetyltransferase [Ramlibacter ginsenosidimutans]MBK6004507.1 GNAT family acetyltransferase [Ramlibacter ginsenosidimutans]